MISKWIEKKLTFVMIPDANRQIKQYKVSLLWVYLLPAFILTLAISSFALLLVQGVMVNSIDELKAEWIGDRRSFEKTVAAKEEEITLLQEEVSRLTRQTEAFAAKVGQLQQLESDLLSLTKSTASKPSEKPASISLLSAPPPAAEVISLGVGGEFQPIDSVDTLEMSGTVLSTLLQLETEADRLKGSLTDLLAEAEKAAYLRSITPSIFPTQSQIITSMFGYRRDPFTNRSAFHRGIDFAGNANDPVYATAAGKVTRTGYDKAMGLHVFISHGNGLETVYMHLNKVLVDKGEKVSKGDKIGLIGSTGRSTGPHLHYEVLKYGEAINPRPYFPK